MTADYTAVTELPGCPATGEQLARLYQRYHLAADLAAGKRVLEVACGAGLGLSYIACAAKSVVGGDYTSHLLDVAQVHLTNRVPLIRLDAPALPFRDGQFDVVLILEAIYYLATPDELVAESYRVLEPGGSLLIGTVNKDWAEFAASPFSVRYFSVPELSELVGRRGFTRVECYGGFPTEAMSVRQRLVGLLRRGVVALHLMPRTLDGRARVKRLFYGKLAPLPNTISNGMTELCPLHPLASNAPSRQYKIVYCLAQRPCDGFETVQTRSLVAHTPLRRTP